MAVILRRFIHRNRGQSMVEMALVLPLLLLVSLGISEFGNAWRQNTIVSSAARDSIRFASRTSPYNTAATINLARTLLTNAGLPGGSATITVSTAPDIVTGRITITIQVPYHPITGGFIPGIGGIRLTGSTTMRWEG